jgi:5-methylcytosine-specific restriction endonuclease McrA
MRKCNIEKCTVDGCNRKHYAKGFCSYHYYRKRNNPILTQEERRNRKCSFEGCEERHWAKEYCQYHYYKFYNSTRQDRIKELQSNYQKSERGKEASKKASSIRRARKKGVLAESFSHKEIFNRDNYICCVCGLPIDRSLKKPDMLSVSLEHIFPLSKGGAHSRENVSCSHLICNIRKNTNLLEPNFEGASI